MSERSWVSKSAVSSPWMWAAGAASVGFAAGAVSAAAWCRRGSPAAAAASSAADVEVPEYPHFRSERALAPGRPVLKNDTIVRAARGELTERVPVWAMRQAGRYLPEFRNLRKHHDFFTMCSTPELAAEITLQPLRRFRGLLDAVVIFSDILIVPQAMGLECIMVPGKGPVFPAPLRDPAQISKLELSPSGADDGPFAPLYAAIRETRRLMEDEVPVVGFCGGPWTLLTYMVDGGGTKTFCHSKTWLFKYPTESKALLSKLADSLADMLVGQWRAGASLLQVFESSAGELSPDAWEEFSLPYLLQIAKRVRSSVPAVADGGPPLVCFARAAHHAYEPLSGHYNVLGVDWAVRPSEVVSRVRAADTTGTTTTLQGNLDPGHLYGTKESIRKATRAMLEGFGTMPLIANLGWGMHPTHKPEGLRAYFEAVHSESRKLRSKAE